MKRQLIENQCFTKLLEEVFFLGKVDKSETGSYKTHELEDLAERIGKVGKGKIARQTLVDHWKLKDKIPSISKLSLYCRYCKAMNSEWCQVDTWAKLYRQYKEEEGLVEGEKVRAKKRKVFEEDKKVVIEEDKKTTDTPLLVTNVWYTPVAYSFWDFWRKTDEGVVSLDYDKKQIYFSSDKTVGLRIEAKAIKRFFQAKMPGDISHSWVKILYEEAGKPKVAWFQPRPQGSTRGIANWVGGGGDFYKAIYDLIDDADDE